MISQLLFAVILIAAVYFFTKKVKFISRNIKLGKNIDRTDSAAERWKTMAKVALGQSKMVARPIAGFLHILVYVGFVIINIEVLEILIDGLAGTHRVFAFLGGFYSFLIASFEVLALLVLVSCIIFLIRRNVLKVKRFHLKEMVKWPTTDANIILIIEIALMSAFLKMNAADQILQARGVEHYVQAGMFPISALLVPIFENLSTSMLIFIERATWWFHIVGILIFLNYLPYSKHFHIILAFPNTYFSNLKKKGYFTNMESVTNEVKLMFDPSADPYATPAPDANATPQKFGAKDVTDLSWVSLMNAYSCTECGRCSSECPANQTGKLLSPRKIMMDTRDRLDEVGKNMDTNGGKFVDDGKSLLNDYITVEELRACTSCNACVQACPVNIDPLAIITDLRRYLVMEESNVPQEWAMMATNIENNGAPWQFSPEDRLKWTDGIELKQS